MLNWNYRFNMQIYKSFPNIHKKVNMLFDFATVRKKQ